MSVELRHYCRNLKCRSRLPAPIENVRKAFCCRRCHSAFYRTRCLVCEKDTGTNPLTGEKRKRLGQRKFCGRKCKAEARQFPHVYAWVIPDPVGRTRSSSSCDKMGLKTGPARDRPTSHCLRGWRWGGDGDRDHSLYDRDGLTVARVVLEGDGRYHLQKPIAIPRQAWARNYDPDRLSPRLGGVRVVRSAMVAGRAGHRAATRPQGQERLAECPPDAG
jgi:hypothetical protein